MRPQSLLMKTAELLLALVSLHLVLVALYVLSAERAQASLFGQNEDVKGRLLWVALLLYCGGNGLLMVRGSKSAGRHALMGWTLLSMIHVWYFFLQPMAMASSCGWSWLQVAVQISTDVVCAACLVMLLRDASDKLSSEKLSIVQPLLSTEDV